MASIYKHRSSWRAEIRRQGHGKLSQSFKTKGRAETWARLVEQQIDAGVYVVSEKANALTMTEVIDIYIEKRACMKQGYDTEMHACRDFKQQQFSKKKIGQIRPPDIAAYRDSLQEKGAAPGTIKRKFTVLSAIFTYAQTELDMSSLLSPVKQIRLPHVDDARNRIFVADEEERFFDAARYYARGLLVPLCQFAIETTMRRGEILGMNRLDRQHDGLTWSMVHTDKKILCLPAKITKSGVARDVPLSPQAIGIIEEMRQFRGEDNAIDRVFPMTADALRNGFRRAISKAQIEDFRFHDLRHVGATKWSRVLSQLELMRLTGHKDPRMLARYYNEEASSIAEKMSIAS